MFFSSDRSFINIFDDYFVRVETSVFGMAVFIADVEANRTCVKLASEPKGDVSCTKAQD